MFWVFMASMLMGWISGVIVATVAITYALFHSKETREWVEKMAFRE